MTVIDGVFCVAVRVMYRRETRFNRHAWLEWDVITLQTVWRETGGRSTDYEINIASQYVTSLVNIVRVEMCIACNVKLINSVIS